MKPTSASKYKEKLSFYFTLLTFQPGLQKHLNIGRKDKEGGL
jgi:hypothetical protein